MCTDVNPKIRDVDYREMPGIPGSTSLRKAWELSLIHICCGAAAFCPRR